MSRATFSRAKKVVIFRKPATDVGTLLVTRPIQAVATRAREKNLENAMEENAETV